ncbi:GNAT family N-acetyltransferase [Vagococcus vulneris]|uniref:N-acetyltransferase domain-containing protein n=1 Tax=Vagococcus vulneris TaxID=1977869 RepID=A0A429ZZF3_9ENTE|nr:hypothetical protein CBF37_05225 [Vagococcus vulneris]
MTCVELAFIIHTEFQHKGYGIEAAKAILNYAYGYLNLEEIVAQCDKEIMCRPKSCWIVLV